MAGEESRVVAAAGGGGARTALVTGGTRRLGLAIAERLRADGWRVLTSSHRLDAGADIVADLAEPLGAARLYAAAMRLNGGRPPDALINNAALFAGDAASVAAVGSEAPQKLTALMAGRESGRGAVVNVLDAEVVSAAQPQWAGRPGAYVAAKRALAEATRRQAAMFAETLSVNAVAPGPVLPPESGRSDGAGREQAGECPLGRPTPDAVAAAVSYLLSAPFTSGCTIPVDGGQSILI